MTNSDDDHSRYSLMCDLERAKARFAEVSEECGEWRVAARTLERRCKELEEELDEVREESGKDGGALGEIAAERGKQRMKWGDEHDDEHTNGELAVAAAQLAVARTDEMVTCKIHDPDMWSLVHSTEDGRRQLVIAAALLVAEIDREWRQDKVKRVEAQRELNEYAAGVLGITIEKPVATETTETGIVAPAEFAGDGHVLFSKGVELDADNVLAAAERVKDAKKASSRRTSPVYGTTPEPVVERSQRDGLTRKVSRMTDFGIEWSEEEIASHNLGELSFVPKQRLTQVKIKPIHPELGKSIPLPARATPEAVGYDVCAAIDGPFDLYGQGQALIPLGFAVEIPRGYEMQIRPRSGLALEHGVTVLNAPGTIDPDYRGEVQVLLISHNVDSAWSPIRPGDRIAQIVFAPVETPELVLTDELSETERGEGGFGSTDKKGGLEC